ncbi:MAG: hypothetical protein J0H55_14735 [Chitinophagaceae bacterium]|nr:hypothetical protein [Chitinophagaceae bacterium]
MINNNPSVTQKPKNNMALSAIFQRMSDCYRYLGAEERFRATAYSNASKMLADMPEDISVYATDVKSLAGLKDIGISIAEKIIEYLQTGRIDVFEQLKKRVPFELLELIDVSGLGPATVRALYEELGTANRQTLIEAVESGRLKGLKGFGKKKIDGIRRALKILKPAKRMLLEDAQRIANGILEEIKKITGIQKVQIAGSLRRRKETIGDIDIVAVAPPQFRKRIVTHILNLPQVKQVLASGTTKISVVLKEAGAQVDIRLINDYEYGAALLYFTGSREHTILLRTIAKKRGYRMNEYGIFDVQTGKRMAGATEEEMYHFLGLRYIPPEKRLGENEIEEAKLQTVSDSGK